MEGTFPKTKGMRSVKIRLQNSSPTGMDTPKPSAKTFEIQNGTCIVKRTLARYSSKNREMKPKKIHRILQITPNICVTDTLVFLAVKAYSM